MSAKRKLTFDTQARNSITQLTILITYSCISLVSVPYIKLFFFLSAGSMKGGRGSLPPVLLKHDDGQNTL